MTGLTRLAPWRLLRDFDRTEDAVACGAVAAAGLALFSDPLTWPRFGPMRVEVALWGVMALPLLGVLGACQFRLHLAWIEKRATSGMALLFGVPRMLLTFFPFGILAMPSLLTFPVMWLAGKGLRRLTPGAERGTQEPHALTLVSLVPLWLIVAPLLEHGTASGPLAPAMSQTPRRFLWPMALWLPVIVAGALCFTHSTRDAPARLGLVLGSAIPLVFLGDFLGLLLAIWAAERKRPLEGAS